MCVFRGECTHFLRCNYPDKPRVHRCAGVEIKRALESVGKAGDPPTKRPRQHRSQRARRAASKTQLILRINIFVCVAVFRISLLHTHRVSFVSAAHDLDNDKWCLLNDNHLFCIISRPVIWEFSHRAFSGKAIRGEAKPIILVFDSDT